MVRCLHNIKEVNQMIIGVTKLAKELGLSRYTIYEYIKKGMPHSKGGANRIVFELEEVKEWLKGK